MGAFEAHEAFQTWYASLPPIHGGKIPAKGTIAGALVVLDRLQRQFDLSIEAHTARGGSQVSGAGRAAVKSILARFGETRPFLQEGGRTNRGLRGEIRRLLDAIAGANLDQLPETTRNEVLTALQRFLVEKVNQYHELQRLAVTYEPSRTIWQFIHDLLNLARDSTDKVNDDVGSSTSETETITGVIGSLY